MSLWQLSIASSLNEKTALVAALMESWLWQNRTKMAVIGQSRTYLVVAYQRGGASLMPHMLLRVFAQTTTSNNQMKKDDQIPPQGDARYRTHWSVKCYIAELRCGTKWCTWDFSESIERVVYLFPGNIEKVVYKNCFYELKPAPEMETIVISHLNDKGAVNISGIHLASYEKDKSFKPYPFIDITDAQTYKTHEKLRNEWLQSEEFKSAK